VLDSFASDGAVSQVAEAGASHIPELFRSVEGVVKPITAPAVRTVGAKQMELTGWVEKGKGVVKGYITPPPWSLELGKVWEEWWRKDRLAKVAQGCLPFRELDALVIEGLWFPYINTLSACPKSVRYAQQSCRI
jgi:nucleoporin NDC1